MYAAGVVSMEESKFELCGPTRNWLYLQYLISSSHHRLQGLNVGESREMAWGQSGMARGDSSDAGSGGQGHPVLSPGHQICEIRHQAQE